MSAITWVAGLMNPTVVSGSVVTDALNYKCKASETFKAGELIRLTNAATVAVGVGTTATAAAIHGIALADAADYLTGGDFAGKPIPVALVNKDTVLAIQMNGSKVPSDLPAGAQTTLSATSNYWSVLDVATAAVAVGYGQPIDDSWFDPDASDTATAPVYVTILDSVLNAIRTA